MIVAAVVGFAVCVALAIGCVIADKLFPQIPFVERYIERLPLGGDNGHDSVQ